MGTPRSRSIFKAFNLLNAFQRPDEWLTGCELSRRANLPIASGYRLIRTLTEVGAIVRGPRGYRPGMLLVSLSRNVAIGELLREASHVLLTELSNRYNITVHLGLLEDGMVSYVAKLFTPTSFATHTRAGRAARGLLFRTGQGFAGGVAGRSEGKPNHGQRLGGPDTLHRHRQRGIARPVAKGARMRLRH